jgi:serine/threonine protein kinase
MTGTLCPDCGGVHEPGTGPCSESPLVGPTLPDGFRVLGRVRETSFGSYCRAEYADSGVEVDFIFLRPEKSGREPSGVAPELARLRDRLSRATSLKHPNIARILAVGDTPEGARYIAFEVLRGELLSEILDARHIFPLKEAIDLTLQAAAGLQAAHEAGLYHGNLSPHSILVPRKQDGRALTVKLIAFGVVEREALSVADQDINYMAPERLAGQAPDVRSDVFSLGAVLHRLLTGVPPGAKPVAEEPIPKPVRRVLAKAIAPSAAKRFQTIAEFTQALSLAAERPSARPRTQRVLAASALGLAAGLALAVIWLLWFY